MRFVTILIWVFPFWNEGSSPRTLSRRISGVLPGWRGLPHMWLWSESRACSSSRNPQHELYLPCSVWQRKWLGCPLPCWEFCNSSGRYRLSSPTLQASIQLEVPASLDHRVKKVQGDLAVVAWCKRCEDLFLFASSHCRVMQHFSERCWLLHNWSQMNEISCHVLETVGARSCAEEGSSVSTRGVVGEGWWLMACIRES